MPASEKNFPGRPLNRSARVWNKLIDKANEPNKTSFEKQRQPSGVDIYVRNDTGSPQQRGAVLSVYDMILDDFDPDNLWFAADDGTQSSRTYGVLLHALPAGEIGPMRIEGICAARVNVTSSSHRRARHKSGQTTFESCADTQGATIFYQPSGTGVLLCAVRLGIFPSFRLGITNEFIAKNSSGSVAQYLPNSYSAETASGFNLTARNWYRDIEANTRVGMLAVDGVIYIITGDCEPEASGSGSGVGSGL